MYLVTHPMYRYSLDVQYVGADYKLALDKLINQVSWQSNAPLSTPPCQLPPALRLKSKPSFLARVTAILARLRLRPLIQVIQGTSAEIETTHAELMLMLC